MNLISTLHTLDSLVAHFFSGLRTPLLTQAFELITVLGAPITTTAITLIAAAIIYKTYRGKTYLISLITTTISAGLTIYITKILIHRQRPLDALITEKSFSFPSGHALISVALYGLLTYIIYITRTKKWQKITTISTGIILILLIGISRLYLGVHYFSDVLGGYLIGGIWLTEGIMIIKKTANERRI